MRLVSRLQELETRRRPPMEPPLRIIVVDEDGRWWEREQEIDPEAMASGPRVILRRYRATDEPRCA